ncbi:MAG: alanine racemase [Lachnospiraceae bacterium]|nr:alanine racemase [Lachnospiraceae bacterium]
MERYARGYAEVNLDAIVSNMKNMKAHVKADTRMMGVIKTDGYGHGSIPIAKELEKLSGMYGFAVATAEEAFELREAGIKLPILILGYTFPDDYAKLIEWDISLTVFRMDSVELLSREAAKQHKMARVHIKVDTGMGRIGILPDEEGLNFVRHIAKIPGIVIEGIFTHFARADEVDKENAIQQLSLFRHFTEEVENATGLKGLIKHCANSAGILELPEANMDVVRAGISLYGLAPSKDIDMSRIPLKPAMAFYSTVVYIKWLPAGSPISYGGTYVTDKKSRIATIPLGYGDGYPRGLSGKGYVLIRGQKAPIVGRICMDQFMVDVTDIPEVREGDRVTLMGRDGEEEISAEMLGELSGRFNYELVCMLSKRIPRVYIGGE